MDKLLGLLGTGWIEWLIVGVVLVAAGTWLLARAIRFLQGRSGCDCAGRCPAERILGTLSRSGEAAHDDGQR